MSWLPRHKPYDWGWDRRAHHLWWKLYRAFVILAVLALISAGITFHLLSGENTRASAVGWVGPTTHLLMERLPPPRDPRFPAALDQLARRMDLDIAVWDRAGFPLAVASDRPFPPPRPFAPGFMRRHGAFVTVLADGSLVGLRPRRDPTHPWRLFLILAVVGAVLAVGSYPVARHVTRRLEFLSEGARRWAEGRLDHRVPVVGEDEVANVSRRFNEAAERIEALLAQQRQMVANASHELRSPLARMRLALELADEAETPEARRTHLDQAKRDIADLDHLVEELLLSARAQPGVPRRPMEMVNLRGVAEDEAARVGAQVSGDAATIQGDHSMLRHLLRNLLENARRHGGQTPIDVQLRTDGQRTTIQVLDRGPGVPEGERERIFAPFYRLPGAPAEGTGLGLSLVRQVAQYHGGDVRCLPREGGGSVFEVTLPMHPRT